jgi:hypothetical protein
VIPEPTGSDQARSLFISLPGLRLPVLPIPPLPFSAVATPYSDAGHPIRSDHQAGCSPAVEQTGTVLHGKLAILSLMILTLGATPEQKDRYAEPVPGFWLTRSATVAPANRRRLALVR